MLNVTKLPKDPIEALKYSLSYGIDLTQGGTAKLIDLQKANHRVSNELVIIVSVVKGCAKRIIDDPIRELILQKVSFDEQITLKKISANLEEAINAVIAYQLDEHFLDDKAVQIFDDAVLDEDEKTKIRCLMAEARRCVDNSQTLAEWQRKGVLHHIAKIESELHKEKSKFDVFLAAAYSTSQLVKKFGEDAQPLAEAFQKALTITNRKVEGQILIERDEEPRQLPKPKAKGNDN